MECVVSLYCSPDNCCRINERERHTAVQPCLASFPSPLTSSRQGRAWSAVSAAVVRTLEHKKGKVLRRTIRSEFN